MLELYHSGHSTCSKQVRLCLAEKGLPYISRYIELWSYENLAPEYLKLNPTGVVPTLVHDGVAIVNSFCILEYVEDVFPEMPLRPADPVMRARQRLWSWTADDVHPALADATHSQSGFGKRMAMDRATIDKVAAMTPAPDRRARFMRNAVHGYSERDLAAAWDKIVYTLGRLESALAEGPWIVGSQYTLADVAMLAIVDRVREMRPELIDKPPQSRLAAWHAAAMVRPAVAKVFARGGDEVPPRPDTIELRIVG